ncbi:hypothetical protein Tco_1375147 [Tanacetum coccineum]
MAHYRMSPTERDTLQGMVEELLKKDVTQESKSPCAVPALLIPNKDKTRYLLHGSQVFSIIDLRSGYHQLQILEMNVRLLLRQRRPL